MKLVDKDKIAAEIEGLKRNTFTNFDEGVNAAAQILLDFLDTLEVKEVEEEPVSEDLGEAANTYVDNWYKLNNLDKESYPIDVEISKNDFKAGAKWQKEQGITKAYDIQMAMKWLREVHDIFIKLEFDVDEDIQWHPSLVLIKGNKHIHTNGLQWYNTYEQACEAAIKYCLENLI